MNSCNQFFFFKTIQYELHWNVDLPKYIEPKEYNKLSNSQTNQNFRD
jgi:hypothetical protein